MLQPHSMNNSLYKQIITLHSVPFYFLLLTCFVSATLIFAFCFLGWVIWQIALLIILAWLPIILYTMTSIYQQYKWLAFLFLLVVAQGGHMIEHTAQMIQLHLLGLRGPQASGLIGALNIEWVHLIWNSWVLVMCVLPLFCFRKNLWLRMLFVFAIYHEVEHVYIISVYLRTHIEGTPGLLARGGLIAGGLPIARPDLHFLYAVLEEALLLIAYYSELRKIRISDDGTVKAMTL